MKTNVIQKYTSIEAAMNAYSLLPINPSQDEVKAAANNLPKLKKLLEAAGIYRKNASKYLRLEAQTWVDITEACAVIKTIYNEPYPSDEDMSEWVYWKADYELVEIGYSESIIDVTGEFTDAQLKIIKLLASLSDDARHQIPSKCASELKSVSAYASRAQKEKMRYRRELELLEAGEMAVREYKHYGKVDISLDKLTNKYINNHVDETIIDAFKDRVKDRLLRNGAVGIGENIYVNPDNASSDEIISALKKRYDVLSNTLNSFNELIKKLNVSASVIPKETIDEWSRKGLAMKALKAYTGCSSRQAPYYEAEFERMINHEGEYAWNCAKAYKLVREAVLEAIEDDYRYLVNDWGTSAEWLKEYLHETAMRIKEAREKEVCEAMLRYRDPMLDVEKEIAGGR